MRRTFTTSPKAIKASTGEELVNLYAKTEDGWKLIFTNIPESQAEAIWSAGFKTGQNNFSIEKEEDRRIAEMNRRTLRGER